MFTPHPHYQALTPLSLAMSLGVKSRDEYSIAVGLSFPKYWIKAAIKGIFHTAVAEFFAGRPAAAATAAMYIGGGITEVIFTRDATDTKETKKQGSIEAFCSKTLSNESVQIVSKYLLPSLFTFGVSLAIVGPNFALIEQIPIAILARVVQEFTEKKADGLLKKIGFKKAPTLRLVVIKFFGVCAQSGVHIGYQHTKALGATLISKASQPFEKKAAHPPTAISHLPEEQGDVCDYEPVRSNTIIKPYLDMENHFVGTVTEKAAKELAIGKRYISYTGVQSFKSIDTETIREFCNPSSDDDCLIVSDFAQSLDFLQKVNDGEILVKVACYVKPFPEDFPEIEVGDWIQGYQQYVLQSPPLSPEKTLLLAGKCYMRVQDIKQVNGNTEYDFELYQDRKRELCEFNLKAIYKELKLTQHHDI